MMIKAIEELLSDVSFHVPLEPAITAFRQGTCVLQWASEVSNSHAFNTFETAVTSALQTCLPEASSNIKLNVQICGVHTIVCVPRKLSSLTGKS